MTPPSILCRVSLIIILTTPIWHRIMVLETNKFNEVEQMDRENTIFCIQNRRYMVAANFITKGILQEKIHVLGQKKREQVTRVVAKMIKGKHTRLRADDIGLKPKEIAEQVYDETIMELMSPASTSNGNLSDQLEDD